MPHAGTRIRALVSGVGLLGQAGFADIQLSSVLLSVLAGVEGSTPRLPLNFGPCWQPMTHSSPPPPLPLFLGLLLDF